MQFEYELSSFCKQDQKDLVCYLQRQLLVRDQRITELSYDLEQLRNASLQQQQQLGESVKLEPIQILRFDDPDLVISTVSTFVLFFSPSLPPLTRRVALCSPPSRMLNHRFFYSSP